MGLVVWELVEDEDIDHPIDPFFGRPDPASSTGDWGVTMLYEQTPPKPVINLSAEHMDPLNMQKYRNMALRRGIVVTIYLPYSFDVQPAAPNIADAQADIVQYPYRYTLTGAPSSGGIAPYVDVNGYTGYINIQSVTGKIMRFSRRREKGTSMYTVKMVMWRTDLNVAQNAIIDGATGISLPL